MRKKERAIKDRKDIDGIIRRCRVCRLAMSDDDQPYIIPLNFGYDGFCLYFHAAPEGRKIDILKRNNRVGFEFDIL
ncbi:MAG: pyridoxamine 5'-phosphate oxidase family protein, partial [Deltaproteobacteria bacterium]|nr:pyridoxamine 5'-phosphate oxidase family protein [Deltaproteobacteria bacterium]